MYFDFLTPDVWNGLVIGTILIGGALAILRLVSDWTQRDAHSPASDERDHDHARS